MLPGPGDDLHRVEADARRRRRRARRSRRRRPSRRPRRCRAAPRRRGWSGAPLPPNSRCGGLDEGDGGDPGDLGGHGVHHDARRVDGLAARARRARRARPAASAARCVAPGPIARLGGGRDLRGGRLAHPRDGLLERRAHLGGQRLDGGVDLGLRHAQRRRARRRRTAPPARESAAAPRSRTSSMSSARDRHRDLHVDDGTGHEARRRRRG